MSAQGGGPTGVTVITPRERPVGSGSVRRLLPFRTHRQVGPFTFADLIGPDRLTPGEGMDVDAHPHIGLATVTYLFEGALVHRDSTGAVQRIDPGDVNWMTAGSGVCHTERSPDDLRANGGTVAGLQTWVALPDDHELDAPSFQHVGVASLPSVVAGDALVRLVVGDGFGLSSPVAVASPLVLADVTFPEGGRTVVPADHPELAILAVDADLTVAGTFVPEGHLAVLPVGVDADVVSSGPARLMVLGGRSVGPRLIWWNYVASSQELIDDAKQRWRDQRFPLVPDDHHRWTPQPGDS
jgi:redox-sensitive bicupin YhaK (pirin superfamily)